MPELISWSEAKALGLKRYFTGKPCPHGHIAERLVSNRRCNTCIQQDREQWGKDNPEKLSAREKHYYRNRPGYREKKIATAAQWAKDHPAQANASQARYRNKNREKMRIAVKRSKAVKPEYYLAKKHAFDDLRRAGPACPPWADHEAIFAFLIARPPGKTVDHIVPLGSDKRPGMTAEGYPIRGLHVAWNLQYITLDENRTKRLRMRPEDQAICERPRIRRPRG